MRPVARGATRVSVVLFSVVACAPKSVPVEPHRVAHPLALKRALEDPETTYLKLEDHGLTAFPVALLELKKLERLDLDGNAIPSVPEGIGDLVHLVELDLDDNLLTELPDNRGTVTPLRVGKGSLRPPLSAGAACGDSFVNRSEA